MAKIKEVTMVMNEVQARVVMAALEEWFRIRMGQSHDLANDLAFMGYKHDKSRKDLFDLRIQTRDSLDELIKAMFRIAWPHYGTPDKIEPQTHIASDMWSAIRHALWEVRENKETWTVDSGEPFQMGPEPMVKVIVTMDDFG